MLLTWLMLTLTLAAQGTAQRPAPAKPKPAPVQSPSRGTSGGGGVTAFVNVSVIPMDKEQVLTGQTVLVRGKTITQVGPSAQVAVPAGATRVDGQGKFLIPGLGDMHMHFFSAEDDGHLTDWYVQPRLYCYASNGVTTIRPIASDTSIKDLAAKVAKGEMVGPRMYPSVTTNQLSEKTNYGALKSAGFDFISVTANGQITEPAAIETLAASAKQAGLRLSGDVPGSLGLTGALKAPYGSIEQLQGYLEQLILVRPEGYRLSTLELDSLIRNANGTPHADSAKMAALAAATQKAGVWNVPAEAASERMVELWSGKTAAQNSAALKIRRDMIKALHTAGAGLLLGSDAPTWGSDYGLGVHEELQALVGSGLTPYQALETATTNVANFLGNADSAGTIATGKRADLVLLNGNPLTDIKNTMKPAGVMLDGQWLSKAKLDAKVKIEDCSGR